MNLCVCVSLERERERAEKVWLGNAQSQGTYTPAVSHDAYYK